MQSGAPDNIWSFDKKTVNVVYTSTSPYNVFAANSDVSVYWTVVVKGAHVEGVVRGFNVKTSKLFNLSMPFAPTESRSSHDAYGL